METRKFDIILIKKLKRPLFEKVWETYTDYNLSSITNVSLNKKLNSETMLHFNFLKKLYMIRYIL